jgi:hypothetical protein
MVNKDLDGQCHTSPFNQITEVVYEKQITPDDGNEHSEYTVSNHLPRVNGKKSFGCSKEK